MSETRKIAAILCSDVVGFSQPAGADEERILARLRTLRSDMIDPTISVQRGLAPWRYDQQEDFARPRFGCVTYAGVSGRCADCHAAIN